MASTYLSTTFASAGNRKTWTFSAWFKRGNLSTNQRLFSGGDFGMIGFDSTDDRLTIRDEDNNPEVKTSQVFRDVSAWYHVVVASDTTQVTSSDRVKIYVNGNLITDLNITNYPSQNYDWQINSNVNHFVGAQTRSGPNSYFDGSMAHVNFTDGTAYDASAFGETDTNGQWKPKTAPSVTYGTNGFFLKFANSGSLGTDSSGNGNDFTKNGSGDQVTDTPDNIFCTWNPLDTHSGNTFSEGNLKLNGANSARLCSATFAPSKGKWYQEFKLTNVASGSIYIYEQSSQLMSDNLFTAGNNTGIYFSGPSVYQNGSNIGSITGGLSNNDILGIALDLDNNNVYFSKNGLWTDGIGGDFDQSDFSNAQAFSLTRTSNDNKITFSTQNGSSSSSFELIANWGNPSFAISSGNTDDNGYGNFEYAPPSGYLALCTKNLATELSPTIDDGSAYFHTQTYQGDGSSAISITNNANAGDFQPDWLWIKNRTGTYATRDHKITDSSRDATKYIESNTSDAEATYPSGTFSFDTDGFTVGDDYGVNPPSGTTSVAWQWKVNGGTTSSNSDGSITTTLQSNATSGFAIATWSGTGTAGTIGHGLGVQPKLVIVKRRNSPASSWLVQHGDLASNFVTFLNRSDTGGETDSSVFNGTYPTSSVFSVGTHAGTNQSGGTYVGYIFAPITGYSAIGKYTGNGSTNGTFIYTGFRPQWIMWKRTDSAADWEILDDKINPFNEMKSTLEANTSDTVGTEINGVDMLSNGFKHRNSYNSNNASGGTYIYMAFAENPFVSSTGIPVVAR